MAKYYLWDWYGCKTIKYDKADFHSKDYAAKQGCFTRFSDCKKHGIKELEREIENKKQQLKWLKQSTIADTGRKIGKDNE